MGYKIYNERQFLTAFYSTSLLEKTKEVYPETGWGYVGDWALKDYRLWCEMELICRRATLKTILGRS